MYSDQDTRSLGWVAPFGYPWINACSRLPMAFRSVPRPSSPPGAKASTERPSLALSHAKSEARASDFPSCTGTIQPVSQRAGPIPIHGLPSNLFDGVPPMPSQTRQLREQPPGRDGRAIKHIHSLHASEHSRLRGLGSLSRSSSGQTCNRRVQTRQTLIHMSKEQNQAFRRRPSHIRTTIARLPRQRLRSMLMRSAFPPRRSPLQMEVDGIEPTTPCLQSRCSPTELHPLGRQTNESFLVLFFKKELLSCKKEAKNFHLFSQSEIGGPGRI